MNATHYMDKSTGYVVREEVFLRSFDPDKYVPAVVIDPEDREQVERLLRGYYAAPGVNVRPRSVTNMQAALRSLAEPPEPPEPMGLGAVVEGYAYTDTLRPFVRCSLDATGWMDDSGNGHGWDEITAFRVLSEGVSDV